MNDNEAVAMALLCWALVAVVWWGLLGSQTWAECTSDGHSTAYCIQVIL